MQNTLIGIVVVLIALGAGYYYFMGGTEVETMDAEMASEGDAMSGDAMQGANAGDVDNNVVEFAVSGENFMFAPADLTVKKGQTVKITFTSASGFHDLVIDEFNVRTKQMQDGGVETVEFVADKTGTFEYYCSVGSHRQMGMVGTLTVTE